LSRSTIPWRWSSHGWASFRWEENDCAIPCLPRRTARPALHSLRQLMRGSSPGSREFIPFSSAELYAVPLLRPVSACCTARSLTPVGSPASLRTMPLAVAFAILILGPWLFGRATAAMKLPAILGMLLFGVAYAALAGGVLDWLPSARRPWRTSSRPSWASSGCRRSCSYSR
jgi:hypothetical protein